MICWFNQIKCIDNPAIILGFSLLLGKLYLDRRFFYFPSLLVKRSLDFFGIYRMLLVKNFGCLDWGRSNNILDKQFIVGRNGDTNEKDGALVSSQVRHRPIVCQCPKRPSILF